MQTTRRGVVKRLLGLPLAASVANLKAFSSGVLGNWQNRGVEEGSEARLSAIRTLRFINTAQGWHFRKFSRYAELREFESPGALGEFINSEQAKKWGMGRSMYSSLRFDGSEVVPGWRLDFGFGHHQPTAYLAVLVDASGRGLGAFATDSEGVIYEGDPHPPLSGQSAWAPAASRLTGGHPIGSTPEPTTRVVSFLRAVALGTDPICCAYACCYCGCCNSSWGKNCGCLDCIWCVCEP